MNEIIHLVYPIGKVRKKQGTKNKNKTPQIKTPKHSG